MAATKKREKKVPKSDSPMGAAEPKARLPRKRAGPKAQPDPSPPPHAPPFARVDLSGFSYEDLLIKSIVDSEKHELVGEDAIAFAAALSSLTPSFRKISYNHGHSVGRALYAILSRRKRYAWHIEGVADLAAFFEKAGYKYVTYNLFPDSIELRINMKRSAPINCRIHCFEAGIIGGFLSAAAGHLIAVSETSCAYDNGRYCRFSTSGFADEYTNTHAEMEGIARFTAGRGPEAALRICSEYQMLAMQPFMGAEYSHVLSQLIAHIGRLAGSELARPNAGPDANNLALDEIVRTAHRLGLGSAKRLRNKGDNGALALSFTGIRAKKGFVEISIRFLKGMLGAATKRGWDAKVDYLEGGAYRAVVKEA
jgi:predicted hydrocarbon binding protein